MNEMREIGHRIKAEQNLAPEDITWLITIAQTILRAFTWDDGQPIRTLAQQLGVSPTTLYTALRLAVQALIWVRRSKASVTALKERVDLLENRLAQLESAYTATQAEVQRLTQALAAAETQIESLQAEVGHLQAQWTVARERLIVVLKLSGRCTVRRIVEVLDYGLGIQVSVGYVQGVLTQAGTNADSVLNRLWAVIPLSGAICVDEVFLKELGTRIWGVVIVDPVSGLVLRLARCSERSKDALGEVLQEFAEAGFKAHIKLCLTDMYQGYVKPVKTHLPRAVHQFCWFHINCFHIGATVHRAQRAYERAVKAVAAFDKQHSGTLTVAEQAQRQTLIASQEQAYRHWQGVQRFQRLLLRALWSPTHDRAAARLEQLIRIAAQTSNPYVQTLGTFLDDHRAGLLVFYTCLENSRHALQRLSHSRRQWVPVTARWAVPITTNAAEHVFRCLRRYTHTMDHFGTQAATQRFFNLFVCYHNLHTLRSGKRAGHSLLTAAHVNVIEAFGTDDLYTILGFPPTTQTFTPVKSVQSTVP